MKKGLRRIFWSRAKELNLSLNTTTLIRDSGEPLHIDEVEGISTGTSQDGIHGNTVHVLFHDGVVQERRIDYKNQDDAVNSKEEETPSTLLSEQSLMGQDKDEDKDILPIHNNEELMSSQSNDIAVRSKVK